jgi:hypothetical protein
LNDDPDQQDDPNADQDNEFILDKKRTKTSDRGMQSNSMALSPVEKTNAKFGDKAFQVIIGADCDSSVEKEGETERFR